MKKLLRLLSAVVVSLSLFGGVAAAQSGCSITNGNGTGATNTCTFTNSTTVNVNCTNGVSTSFVNGQATTSGTATANGNTLVGTVSSGNSSNLATLANEVAQFCNAQPASSTTTTTTPPAGGSGGGSGAAAPKTLPQTGRLSAVQTTAIATTALAAVAGAVQLAVSLYRRRSLN